MPAARPRLLAAVALAAVLAGCGTGDGGEGGAGATSSTAPGTPAGEPRVVESAEHGFALTLPAGWTEVFIDTATLQRLAEEEGGLDEGLANQVRVLAGRGGKLLAFEEGNRTTNLNVLELPSTEGTTPEAVAAGLPAELAGAGLRDVNVEMVTVAAGPAVKAAGTQTVAEGVDLLQLQYYVVAGDSLFVCVLATDDPGRDRATLEAIAQSFTLR